MAWQTTRALCLPGQLGCGAEGRLEGGDPASDVLGVVCIVLLVAYGLCIFILNITRDLAQLATDAGSRLQAAPGVSTDAGTRPRARESGEKKRSGDLIHPHSNAASNAPPSAARNSTKSDVARPADDGAAKSMRANRGVLFFARGVPRGTPKKIYSNLIEPAGSAVFRSKWLVSWQSATLRDMSAFVMYNNQTEAAKAAALSGPLAGGGWLLTIRGGPEPTHHNGSAQRARSHSAPPPSATPAKANVVANGPRPDHTSNRVAPANGARGRTMGTRSPSSGATRADPASLALSATAPRSARGPLAPGAQPADVLVPSAAEEGGRTSHSWHVTVNQNNSNNCQLVVSGDARQTAPPAVPPEVVSVTAQRDRRAHTYGMGAQSTAQLPRPPPKPPASAGTSSKLAPAAAGAATATAARATTHVEHKAVVHTLQTTAAPGANTTAIAAAPKDATIHPSGNRLCNADGTPKQGHPVEAQSKELEKPIAYLDLMLTGKAKAVALDASPFRNICIFPAMAGSASKNATADGPATRLVMRQALLIAEFLRPLAEAIKRNAFDNDVLPGIISDHMGGIPISTTTIVEFVSDVDNTIGSNEPPSGASAGNCAESVAPIMAAWGLRNAIRIFRGAYGNDKEPETPVMSVSHPSVDPNRPPIDIFLMQSRAPRDSKEYTGPHYWALHSQRFDISFVSAEEVEAQMRDLYEALGDVKATGGGTNPALHPPTLTDARSAAAAAHAAFLRSTWLVAQTKKLPASSRSAAAKDDSNSHSGKAPRPSAATKSRPRRRASGGSIDSSSSNASSSDPSTSDSSSGDGSSSTSKGGASARSAVGAAAKGKAGTPAKRGSATVQQPPAPTLLSPASQPRMATATSFVIGQAVDAIRPSVDQTTRFPAVVSRADKKKGLYSVRFEDNVEVDGLQPSHLRVQATAVAPSRGPCDPNSGCAKSKCARASDGAVNCMCKCHTAARAGLPPARS